MQFKLDLLKGHLYRTAGKRGGVCSRDTSLIATVGGEAAHPTLLGICRPLSPPLWLGRRRPLSLLHLGMRRHLLIIKK